METDRRPTYTTMEWTMEWRDNMEGMDWIGFLMEEGMEWKNMEWNGRKNGMEWNGMAQMKRKKMEWKDKWKTKEPGSVWRERER